LTSGRFSALELFHVTGIHDAIDNLPTVVVDEASDFWIFVYSGLAATLSIGKVIEHVPHFVQAGQRVTVGGAAYGGLGRKVIHQVFAWIDFYVLAGKFPAVGVKLQTFTNFA
jgi:hypothetical protein